MYVVNMMFDLLFFFLVVRVIRRSFRHPIITFFVSVTPAFWGRGVHFK